jgi:hypothetical protein
MFSCITCNKHWRNIKGWKKHVREFPDHAVSEPEIDDEPPKYYADPWLPPAPVSAIPLSGSKDVFWVPGSKDVYWIYIGRKNAKTFRESDWLVDSIGYVMLLNYFDFKYCKTVEFLEKGMLEQMHIYYHRASNLFVNDSGACSKAMADLLRGLLWVEIIPEWAVTK